MTRRVTADSTESLELLLDTICNTFGAVIFISMLVAVLVSQSTRQREPAEPVEDPEVVSAMVQAEIQQAQERLRVLSGQLRQQEVVKHKFATEDSLMLAGKVKQQTEQRVRFMQEKSEAIKEITESTSTSAVLQNQLLKQQAEFDAAASENQRLKDALKQQEELASRTARIPQVRKTSKQSVAFGLDDGRLVRMTTPKGTVDTTDCTLTDENGGRVVRPRRGRGVTVNASQGKAIQTRFDGIDASNQFVILFVARDSFAEFVPVKDKLVEIGLEYDVRIFPTDDIEVRIGDSKRESFVQ